MENTYPLVSCICITYNRTIFLKKSVACFLEQEYPNKELLIIYRPEDIETRKFLESLNNSNIIYNEIDASNLTLGDIRNKALDLANGEFFCNWDDDDWYHPERITQQFMIVKRTGQSATVLTNLLVYDQLTGDSYFSMFRLWETSILCKKSTLNDTIKYGSINRGEDAILVNTMMETGGIVPLSIPNLLIYLIHGSNTMKRDHFEKLFRLSQKLPDHKSKVVCDIIEGRVSGKEAKVLLSQTEFLEGLNFFHKKAGYLSLSGLTMYRSA